MQYSMMITTASNKKEAKLIAEVLISKRLAACVQVFPIKSFYYWKHKMEKSSELILLIKTVHKNCKKIEEEIFKRHSYDVPEIIELPIESGSKDYLYWISEVCG